MKSDIKSKNVKLKINCAKIINTIEGKSLEGQYLSGKKLIIIGKVCTELFVVSVNNNYSNCHYIEREIPFSTFIILPRDVCDEENIHLEYFIEDISTVNVTSKKLLLSVTFLIEFKEDFLDDNN
ncbi:SPOCS domain-containing protein [Clostridium cagae]